MRVELVRETSGKRVNRQSTIFSHLPYWGGLAILLLVLAGCDRGNSTPTTIPVPGVLPNGTNLAVLAGTPNSESDGSPALATTPTPNLTPTPTAIPAQQLARAQELFQFGDYEATQQLLASLIDEPSTDDLIVAEAQLLLALTYKEEGLIADALVALDPLLEDSLEQPFQSEAGSAETLNEAERRGNLALWASVLAASLFNSQGRYTEALERYETFLSLNPWATELVASRRGGIQIALGESNRAADAYADAAAAATDPSSIAFYQETVAQIALANGQAGRAIEAYEAILDVAKRPAYRAQIQYKAGKAAEAAGNERQAIGFWIAATDETIESDDAHSALVELVNREVDFNLYQRGLINLNNEVWIPAVNAFQAYLDSVPSTDRRAGEAMLGLARANIGLGNYSAALTILNNLLESYPDCTCRGSAWMQKALAQAWLGNSIDARRSYRTFAREYAEDPLAPEALWESGLFAYREGNALEAAADLLSLVDGFPESKRAPLALYLLGLGAYREGLYEQAVQLFGRMVDEYPESDPADAGYWLGRSYYAQAIGKTGSEQTLLERNANSAWEAAVDAAPGEYYSVLSAVALAQAPPDFGEILPELPLVDVSGKALPRDNGSRAFAEAWLSEWVDDYSVADAGEVDDDGDLDAQGNSGSSNEQPMGQLPERILSDPNWLQGEFFLALNQRGDALPLLERLLDDYGDDPRSLYALSLAYERIGAYRLSLIAANRLITASPANFIEDSPIFLQRLIYPKRFAELVEREAPRHNIDPKLFYSLVRQESLFESGARSYAAAQGLAQIIPDTGTWVADKIGYPNYSNDLIYRPHINLWFGAYYLDWARQFLDDNLTAALVGYNAGPGNSQQWRQESGDDDALFVEILTYSEPRLYVRKITSNYYHYLRLYP